MRIPAFVPFLLSALLAMGSIPAQAAEAGARRQTSRIVYQADFAAAVSPALAVNHWKGARYEFGPDRPKGDGEAAARSGPAVRFSRTAKAEGDAQLYCTYPLQPGKRYRITQTLKADRKATVSVFIRQQLQPYLTLYSESIEVGPTPRTVSTEAYFTGPREGNWRWDAPDGVALTISALQIEEIDRDEVWLDRPLPMPDLMFGLTVRALGHHFNWPDLGQRVIRLWDTGTLWLQIQPEPKDVDWSGNANARRLDLYVNYATKHDADVIYTFGGTPRWVASSEFKGAYGPGTSSAPKDMEAWREHVRTLAKRYKGRIRYWEMWNETDYNAFYAGGVEQMVEMTRIAREELKKADPENLLLSPNITSGGVPWLAKFFSLGGDKLVDGVSVHLYYKERPEDLLAFIANVKAVMARHGVDKPLWNTEGGPQWMQQMPEPVMRGLNVRAVLLMWAVGVVNFDYYTMEGMTPPWALVEKDFRTLTVPGESYAFAAEKLRGATLNSAFSTASGIYSLDITTAGGKRWHALWATSPQQLKLPKAWTTDKARIQRIDGSRDEVPATLELNAEPVFLTGVDEPPLKP